jgi:sterol desaturase/sphingolipid hydroxylase (fatty acid hydroxylase superfamily)
MSETLLALEPFIRLTAFAGVFATMAMLEAWLPRRARSLSRWRRWPSNIAVSLLNTGLVRILFPTAAVGAALFAQAQDVGLLNWLALPEALAIVVAVLALDLAIYLQHVMFHAVPLLWRLHRMHHADLDMDVTTGARFHPIEIMLSFVIKLMVVVAIGAPAVAVLIFEVLLNATSMFNHANLRLPARLDAALRWLLVTPDMHRVHHSIEPGETNSNFGFNLPWWDFALGTYRARPAAGHERMTIGIAQFRTARDQWLDRMLIQPVLDSAGSYPIGRRETRP